jgi:hypothetical protein
VTAPARRSAATVVPSIRSLDIAEEYWQRAAEIRDEWLATGLSTAPADRPAAEQAITRLYARHGRLRPRFEWADSPAKALTLVGGVPTLAVLHQWVMSPPWPAPRPFASDLVAGLSRLRGALDGYLEPPAFDPPPPRRAKRDRNRPEPWPVRPAPDLLRAGVPFREVLTQGVRDALAASLGFHPAVRAALGPPGSLPVCWYGQQDAAWIGYYDVWRRLGLARYPGHDGAELDTWAALARSCGWWWPGEEVCVIAERPRELRTEPVPGAWHAEVRLRRSGGPPVVWPDGWGPELS